MTPPVAVAYFRPLRRRLRSPVAPGGWRALALAVCAFATLFFTLRIMLPPHG